MSSMSPTFQYDTLTPRRFRLFKLDLNGEDDELSGQLLSTYHNQNSLDLSLTAFKYMFQEDTDQILERLSDGKEYHALSYCWGDIKATRSLHLSTLSSKLRFNKVQANFEQHRNGTIQITKNLSELLQELRRRRYNRFIWIDAICIDQSSDEEKLIQLPMMRHIYEYAGCVQVWLGTATNRANEALTTIPLLANLLSLAAMGQQKLDPDIPDSFVACGLPEPSAAVWVAIRDLFCRPWWSRLWVLQEVAMAKGGGAGDGDPMDTMNIQILCGDSTGTLVSLNHFALHATSAGIRSWILAGQSNTSTNILNGFDSLEEIRTCRESFNLHGWGISLNALLLATRRRQATVPVDMVIGMMGLLDSHARETLAIRTAPTTASVFVKFAKFYIRNETHEVLLNHVATQERIDGIPSWCPNFASPPENISLGTRWLGHFDLSEERGAEMYCAGFQRQGKWTRPRSIFYYVSNITNAMIGRHPHSGVFDTSNPRQIALMPGSDCIVASGLHMDTVVAVAECNPAAEFDQFLSVNGIRQTLEWDTTCFALAKHALSADTECDAVYARTIVANRAAITPGIGLYDSIVFDRENALDFLGRYKALKQHMEATAECGSSMPSNGCLNQDTIRYAQVLHQITRRRRFFATAGGRIGLGPSDTQAGDLVCVIFYCPTPYILRNAEDGNFNFVGESYVHGLMYGEALAMFDDGKVEETKWVIE